MVKNRPNEFTVPPSIGSQLNTSPSVSISSSSDPVSKPVQLLDELNLYTAPVIYTEHKKKPANIYIYI